MRGRNTDGRAISTAEKERKALELRARGMAFDDIAAEVGYRGRQGAHAAVMRALKKTLQEPADELRILEAERLDRLYEVTMARIDKDNLWAVDRALKIMERRASLFGLDRPPEQDWTAATGSFLAGVAAGAKHAEDLSE